jgi:hypothetical protein
MDPPHRRCRLRNSTRVAERQILRIFISSPSDVRPERLIAERVIRRLDREFQYHFRLEPILWEREPLVATHHFQDLANIPPPRSTDVVVMILWSRLGVPLPAAEFRGAITGGPVTGTEWEFEDALAAARERGVPHLMVYQKVAPVVPIDLRDRDAIADQAAQLDILERFMQRWFKAEDARSFTAAFNVFASSTEFEMRIYDHLHALLDRRMQEQVSPDAASGEAARAIRWSSAPYMALQPFEFEHAGVFFGRTRARNELRELLGRQAARGCAFVMVMGASGSGKSSLVKAGLLPDLMLPGMMGRVALCRRAIMRPSDRPGDPIGALAAALLSPAGLPELFQLRYSPDRLEGLLREAPGQAALPIEQGLDRARAAGQLNEIAEARLILIVDQLEELFTLAETTDTERGRFVQALDALARTGVVWVVATLRSDFFDRVEQLEPLARLSQGEARYLLTPPDGAEIGQMIRLPAREAGLRFEVDPRTGIGLDEVILQAAGASAAVLPLLSFLLDRLWRERTEHGVLPLAAYRRLGGLEGSLGHFADALLRQLPHDVQSALPRLLRSLVATEIRAGGADAVLAARAVPLSRFPAGSPERQLVAAFLAADARLLTAESTGGADSQAMVRVTHEALLTRWEHARRQLSEERGDLALRDRLEQGAVLWDAASADDKPSLLLRPGLPLAQAEALLQKWQAELPAAVIRFIEQSTASRVSEEQRKAAEERVLRETVVSSYAHLRRLQARMKDATAEADRGDPQLLGGMVVLVDAALQQIRKLHAPLSMQEMEARVFGEEAPPDIDDFKTEMMSVAWAEWIFDICSRLLAGSDHATAEVKYSAALSLCELAGWGSYEGAEARLRHAASLLDREADVDCTALALRIDRTLKSMSQ